MRGKYGQERRSVGLARSRRITEIRRNVWRIVVLASIVGALPFMMATPASADDVESKWEKTYLIPTLSSSLFEQSTTDVMVKASFDGAYYRAEANFCTREPIDGNPLSMRCSGDDSFQPNMKLTIQVWDGRKWNDCAWTKWTGRQVDDNLKMKVAAAYRCGNGAYYRTKTKVYFNRPTDGVRVSVVRYSPSRWSGTWY